MAFKDAKAKKATGKRAVKGTSGSIAQRMKARRARASSTPLGGVVDIVDLDDDDTSSQEDTVAAGDRRGVGASEVTQEANPKEVTIGGPRQKNPQIRRAPAPR